jgi:hypothetical protein
MDHLAGLRGVLAEGPDEFGVDWTDARTTPVQ